MVEVNFLLGLVLLFLFAKILGELAERIKLPSLLGEILAGFLLGPALLGFISPDIPLFRELAEIGIILLLFVVGFEHSSIKELLRYKGASITVSALSSTLPIIAVVLFALSQGFNAITSLFLAVALGATSMGVSVRSMLSVNRLSTKPGKTVISSLVLNDMTGLILLAVVTGYAATLAGTGANLLWELAKIALGIAGLFLIFLIAQKVIPRLIRYSVRLRVEEAQFSLVIIVVLGAAYLAQQFGLSTIIGAFLAGLVLSKAPILETASFGQKLSSISYGFFIPIFFAVTGAFITLDNIAQSGKLALIFLGLIATVQIGSAFIASKFFFKYKTGDALIVGTGMLPYGPVTLIVITALLGLATANPAIYGPTDSIQLLFSSVVLLVALSTLLTPILMKIIVKVFPETEK